MIIGGFQEFNKRSGTENLFGILSMEYALQNKNKKKIKNQEILNILEKFFIKQITKRKLILNSYNLPKIPGIFNIYYKSFSNILSNMLILKLSEKNICISSGTACSSGAIYGSRALSVINKNLYKHSIRISFNENNTLTEIQFFWKYFDKYLKK